MQAATAYSFGNLHRVNSHPLKLVAFGDSLIYGFGDGVGGGWVERLRRQWMLSESAGHVLYNLGVRGDRTYQVAQRLKTSFATGANSETAFRMRLFFPSASTIRRECSRLPGAATLILNILKLFWIIC